MPTESGDKLLRGSSSLLSRIRRLNRSAALSTIVLLQLACRQSVTVTSIEEILESDVDTSISYHINFDASFVVSDSLSGILYVQEGDHGMVVFPKTKPEVFQRGDRLRIRGEIEHMHLGPSVVNAELSKVGFDSLVTPTIVDSIRENTRYLNRLISVTGVVRNSSLSLGQYYEIEMGSGMGEIRAKVLDVLTADFDLKDSLIQITGVVISEVKEKGEYKKLEIFSRGRDSFRVVNGGAADPVQLSIAEYLSNNLAITAGNKVQIEGRLIRKNSANFTLADSSGDLTVSGLLSAATSIGEEIKVVGFPPKTNSSGTWSSLMVSSARTDKLSEGSLGLTSIESIKSLSGIEAAAEIEVKVRGQVTFSNDNYFATVQDETAGIFVVFNEPRILEAGRILELEGETRPGSFAPIIRVSKVAELGVKELPVPPEPNMSELNAGLFDSEWLKLQGLVISTESDAVLGDYLMLRNGNDDIKVSVPLSEGDSDRLIGSFVEVEGISLTVFDHTNRILGFQISSPSEEHIRVVKSAPAEPSLEEITPMRNLLRFENISNSLNRVRVEGVVTSIHPSGGFFIQDADGAALVIGQEESDAVVGDWVQAIGFASSRGALTTFMTTKLEILGQKSLPSPSPTSMTSGPEMCNGLDGKLVEVQGILNRVSDYGSNPSLQIGTNDYAISAFLPSDVTIPKLRRGSLLKIKGNCETLLRTHSFVPKPLGSVIYVSSDSGIEVLSLPKTDFFAAYRNLFGFLVGMILLGLGWIAILRKQVHNQTEIIRKRLEIEEALKREAQLANKTKSQFLANMSHEIRTPLTSILGFAEIIAEYEDSKSQDLAEMIGVSGQRLMRTINSVLDLASLDGKGPNLTFQALDLVKKVKEIMQTLKFEAERKGLAFVVSSGVESAMVVADESAIQRILTNLLANAIKFTDNGKVEAKDSLVVLHIIDTGIGIKEESQEVIFEAFSQESMGEGRLYEGNGLGLTIVKKLVNYMSGSITLKSRPNEGSTFTISFPLLKRSKEFKVLEGEESLVWENMDQILKSFGLQ